MKNIKISQTVDPELASPEIKIEPADTLIQKAVELLKKVNPSYFIGVRKIVVDAGQGFGHVSSGGSNDPSVIHLNLSKIKSEVQSHIGTNAAPDQLEKAIVRAIASTIAHEKGHVSSYKPESGFAGGEQPAEAEEHSMLGKVDTYYKNLA